MNAGANDVFVAKYDGDGNLQWVHSFGSSNDDFCTTVDVNLYTEGQSDKVKLAIGGDVFGANNMDVDPGTGTFNINSTGGRDAWIAVYEDNGTSITLEAAASYGGAGSDEGITSLALHYPKTFVTSNFEDDVSYQIDIQQATSCGSSVFANFANGYSPNQSSRGLVISHEVSSSCTTLEAKWAMDPVTTNGGLNTLLSWYNDIKWIDDRVVFGGHKINTFIATSTKDILYPQFGILKDDGSMVISLKNIKPKNIASYVAGGTINVVDVIENPKFDIEIFLGGTTTGDLGFGPTIYPFGSNEAFYCWVTPPQLSPTPPALNDWFAYSFGALHHGNIKALHVSSPAQDDFNLLFGGAFNGTLGLLSSNTLESNNTGTEYDPFWGNYLLEDVGSIHSTSFVYAYDIAPLTGSVLLNGSTNYIDANGDEHTYVTGTFDRTIWLSSSQAITSVGGLDAFLAKYDHNGDLEWHKLFSGALDIEGVDVVCNGSGRVFVSGNFKGNSSNYATLGNSSPYSSTLGSFDGFITKFDPNGSSPANWTNALIVESNTDVVLSDLEIDFDEKHIFLSGHHFEDLTIGASTLSGQQDGSNNYVQSGFVWAFDEENGNQMGNYQVEMDVTTATDYSSIVKMDYHENPNQKVLALGVNFNGTIESNGTTFSSDADDAYVLFMTFDKDDGFEYEDQFSMSGAGAEVIRDMKFNNTSFIYSLPTNLNWALVRDLIISLSFDSEIEFSDNGSTITRTEQSSNADIAVISYNGSDNVLWDKEIDVADLESNSSILIRGETLILTAEFTGTVGISSDSKTATNQDIFVARFSNNGTYIASSLQSVESPHDLELNEIMAQDGSILIFGSADQQLTLPGITPSINNGHRGHLGFVASYDLCSTPPSSSSISSLSYSVCKGGKNETLLSSEDISESPLISGSYFWYEESSVTGVPLSNPMNEAYTRSIQIVDRTKKYWIQLVDERACGSNLEEVSIADLQQAKPVVALVNPSLGNKLCNGPGTTTLDPKNTTTGYTNGTKLTWFKKVYSPANLLYTWEPTSTSCTFPDATGTQECKFTADEAGKYRIDLYDGNGCARSSSVFEVESPMSLTTTSHPYYDCPRTGKDAKLKVASVSGFSYDWQYLSAGSYSSTSPADNDNVLEDIIGRFGQNGLYRCALTDGNNCTLYSLPAQVVKHPTSLDLNHSNNVTGSTVINSNSKFGFNSAIQFFGQGVSDPEDRDVYFYYQGKKITNLVRLDVGTSNAREVDYSDVITQAVNQGFLPTTDDLPGTYFVKAPYDCDPAPTPATYAVSNAVTLTLDCASGRSGYTSISGPYTTSRTNEKLVITGDLIIQGTTAVAFTNCDILVATGVKIIIQQGSSLNLNYTSTYTRPMRIMGCGKWQGIVVEGDASSSTSRGSLSISGNGNLIEISGAEIAVYSKTGGLLDIDGALFTNNQNDVVMSGSTYSNNSTIANSTFSGYLEQCSACSSLPLSSLGAVQSGNNLYMNGVTGVTIEDNKFAPEAIEYVQDVLGLGSNSFGLSGDDCSSILISGNSFDNHHVTAISFDNSDDLVLHDNTFDGFIKNGLSFSDCNGVEFDNSSIFSTPNVKYYGDHGIQFNDCDNVTVNKINFESNSLDYGVLITGGSGISVTESRFQFATAQSIALQVYKVGPLSNFEISQNQFVNCFYSILASPVSNPLIVTGTSNLTAPAMDLKITCNKFSDCFYGIVGSGKFENALGNTTYGAENWFSDLVTGSLTQGSKEWDILWNEGHSTVSGTVEYNYVGSSCSLQVSGGTSYAGYEPNSNNAGRTTTVVLNGTSFSSHK